MGIIPLSNTSLEKGREIGEVCPPPGNASQPGNELVIAHKGEPVVSDPHAQDGDRPSPELHRRLRDPVPLALNYGGGVLVLATLVVMVWKPSF